MITLANGLHHARSACTRDSESHSAILHIRTGDIQFDGRNLLERIDAGCALGIVVGRRTADVDNHIGIDVLNLRIDVLTEIIDTLVLKPYAVEHAAGCLGHTGVIIALTGTEGSALDNDAANAVEGHQVGELQPIAEGA